MTPPGPTIRKLYLGRTLRELREHAHLDRPAAAASLACTLAKISHIENGRNAPRLADLKVLLRLYGADDREDELVNVWAGLTEPGWWRHYRLPSWLELYIGLETDASAISAVQLVMIPGLLQTEAYARAMYAQAQPPIPPEGIDRRVESRMRRQQRLTGGNPPKLSVVLSEAVLQTCIGDLAAGPEQLQHLIGQAELPNVEIRVRPLTKGPHPALAGPSVLMQFPGDLLPDVGYQEGPLGGGVVDEPDQVAHLATFHAVLRAEDQALTPRDSLALISEVLNTS